jgi:hypothetical protein
MMACLDADCTIYFVEQNPVWGPRAMARIAALRLAGKETTHYGLRTTDYGLLSIILGRRRVC